MSLINDALRDLDARKASPAERRGLADNVRALPGERRGFRPHPLPLALLAALLGSGATWLLLRGEPPPPPPPAQVSAAPPPAAPAAEEAKADPGADREIALLLDSSIHRLPRQIEPARPARIETAPPPPRAEAPAPKLETPPAKVQTPPPAKAETPPPPALAEAAPATSAAPAEAPRISRQESAGSPAEAEYQRGLAAIRRGRASEGGEALRAALRLSPSHAGARQALLSQLGEQQRWSDMETLALEGIAVLPQRSDWALLAARLMYERGDPAAALATLDQSAAGAARNADHQILHALLLTRAGRNAEAVVCYQAALALRPNEGGWWYGLARALEAENRAAEAAQSYEKALSTGNLPPELKQAAEQRLR